MSAVEFVEHEDCMCQLLSIEGGLVKEFTYDTTGCLIRGANPIPSPAQPGAAMTTDTTGAGA